MQRSNQRRNFAINAAKRGMVGATSIGDWLFLMASVFMVMPKLTRFAHPVIWEES